MQPPIIAYHVVFGAYGFWLPNDPRGSWSDTVWAPKLVRFGSPVPANTRRSLAAAPHDRALRLAAKGELKYEPVRFTDAQRQAVAAGIADDVTKYALPTYAAAIMPDHVHLMIARRTQTAEQWVGYFKRAASRRLRADGVHPFGDHQDADGRLPTPWVEGGWRVYLHTPEEIERTIRYIEENPVRAGMPRQHWEFITPYQRPPTRPTPRERGG